MFIKTLQIKNFRCFDNEGVIINFENAATALIGRNGGGKTSILEALNYVIGSEYLNSKISERDFHKKASDIKDEIEIIVKTTNPFFLTIDATSDKGQSTRLLLACDGVKLNIKRRERAEKILDDPFVIKKQVIPIFGDIDPGMFEQFLTDKERPVIRMSRTHDYSHAVFQLKTDHSARSTRIFDYQLAFNQNKIQNFPKGYYLTKDRIDEVTGLYSITNKILTDLHWKYQKNHQNTREDLKENYESLATHMRDLVDEKQLLINHINSSISQISCDDQKFKIDFIDMERPFRSAFFSKDDEGKTLLPENLGSGFNILIAYALYSYIADKEKVPIVLIIDEPELHLHTDWQSKMHEIFSQQTGIQIIYSTHSENFVSLKTWRQIRNIKGHKVFPQETLDVVASSDGNSGTPADFLDDYAARNLHLSLVLKENLELFFTKKCIFVEGPGDKYALPKLLSLVGCDLKDHSISIIPVWGKTKIKNYQMIGKCFDLNFFTMFDSDNMEGTAPDEDENILIRANGQANMILEFSSSLEKLLGITNENNKFQKLVAIIDDISDINQISDEIRRGLELIKRYILS